MTSKLTLSDTYTIDLPALVRQGRVQAAIDLLEHSGHPEPRGAIGRLQLKQRNAAFANAPAAKSQPWPRPVDRLLAETGSIPEVAAADLNVDTLIAGVMGSGSLIVRGLVSPTTAAALRAGIDSAMTARDAFKANEVTADEAWYHPYQPEMNKFSSPAASYVCDSPIMALEVSELYRSLGIINLVEQYLLERPALSLRKWVLRRAPVTANAGWHQDGNFLGVDTRNMNLWLGLSDNGVTAPGLDLVPLRLDEIVTSGTGDATFDWSVGSEVVAEILGPHAAVRPDLNEGDAVFFDHMCLHRTGLSADMTETRYAIESWFFAPSHFPSDYEGFLL